MVAGNREVDRGKGKMVREKDVVDREEMLLGKERSPVDRGK